MRGHLTTLRFAAPDADSTDHLLVFSMTMRSVAADGDSMDPFL